MSFSDVNRNCPLPSCGQRIEQPARICGTVLRVANLDRARRFYVEGCGLAQLAVRSGYPESLMLGFNREDGGAALELIEQGETAVTHGTGYGHVAFAVQCVEATFEHLRNMGAEIIIAPAVIAEGGPRCAFVSDPDGYSVELVEGPRSGVGPSAFDPKHVILGPPDGRRRLLHTMLRIGDVERSLDFYVERLGMLLRHRFDIEFRGGITGLFVGYGDADVGRLLELMCYRSEAGSYTQGDGFRCVRATVPDLGAFAARLKALGVTPEAVTAGNLLMRDPDGHRIEFVEQGD